MHKKDFRAVCVTKGDPWHGLQPSQAMKRCDLTAFCTQCGSCSRGYRTKVLRLPCEPRKSETPYHADMLDKLLRVECPYRKSWGSGLEKAVRWPPCELLIFEDSRRHTKCTCHRCRPPDATDGPKADQTDSDNCTVEDMPRPQVCHGPSSLELQPIGINTVYTDPSSLSLPQQVEPSSAATTHRSVAIMFGRLRGRFQTPQCCTSFR